MTTIAAIVTEGGAWIAGDRRVTWGTHYRASAVPKVVERDGWLLGLSGSTVFAAAVAALDVVTPENIVCVAASMTEGQAGGAIMAQPGRLVEIGSGGGLSDIGPTPDGETEGRGWRATAIGSGASEAAGAIMAMERTGRTTLDALTMAIRVAAALDSATGAPFDLLHLRAA